MRFESRRERSFLLHGAAPTDNTPACAPFTAGRKTAPTWTMESAGAMSMVMPRDAGNEAENGEHKNERRRWHEEHEEYGGNDGDDGR